MDETKNVPETEDTQAPVEASNGSSDETKEPVGNGRLATAARESGRLPERRSVQNRALPDHPSAGSGRVRHGLSCSRR